MKADVVVLDPTRTAVGYFRPVCVLDLDSPSPTRDEYRRCGCRFCWQVQREDRD